ncbi:MAG: STM4012 family radical SAM protein [Polyangiales bacterium]
MRSAELDGSPYQSYLYAYPHKTAYRAITPKISLGEAWANESRDALFLYVHVPFCEMRCGFCNLFTVSRPRGELVGMWVDAIVRQARAVRSALPDARFARFAIGGGTPTLLDLPSLTRVLDLCAHELGADLASIPCSVEVSPETVDRDKLALLRARGVDRISIGVQSFLDHEAHAAGRPQQRAKVDAALDAIRAHGFPTLNVDLIYGMAGQTEETFLQSLREALKFRPEELYLYPLYVRPLTGLGKSARSWDDHRLALYRTARDFLLGEGFVQVSMRMFRAPWARSTEGPVYCVQDDGMVGLGVGARSYTRELHYASTYAVSQRAVAEVVEAFVAREDFAHVDHGIVLDRDEQRRRWLAMGLFGEGVDRVVYRTRFDADLAEDLRPLLARDWAVFEGDRLVLTPAGIERSDAIGPFLVSPAVRALMEAHELR